MLGMPILFEFDSLEENFKLAKELNLDFVELNLNFGYCRKEMEEGNVKALLDKYGLKATLHFYDEADMGSYDEVVDAYIKLCEKYVNLGKDYIEIMNFHNVPGPVVTISGIKNYIYAKEYNVYIKKLINNFKRIEKILNAFDIKMVIENVDGANRATFLLDNYNEFHKNGFRFNFDIGHDGRSNNALYEYNKVHNLPFDEFHFHDSNDFGCHLALGEGKIDLKYFKELAIKNNAWVLLEVKSSEDLKKSVPYYNNL